MKSLRLPTGNGGTGALEILYNRRYALDALATRPGPYQAGTACMAAEGIN